jgi:hypothetical protein
VLQSFAKDPGQFSFSGKHEIQGDGIYLESLLNRQSENLDALADCLHDYSEIIRVLEAGLYVDLQQFIAFKGVGVDWIAILLKRGNIPFDSLDLEDLEQLAARSRFMLEQESPPEGDEAKDPLESMGDFLPWYDQVGAISQRMDANSVQLTALFENDQNFDSPVNAENFQRLNDFLRRNDLRHHLTEARENLQKIKTFIETNFSVPELMIDVGSEQLKKKIRW